MTSSASNRSAAAAGEKNKKKKNRRAAIIAVAAILLAAPCIWLAMEYFAHEQLISQAPLGGDEAGLIVRFSEKTSEYDVKTENNPRETGTAHYGYFLGLFDSIRQKSLDRIKFKSPVAEIDHTPEMVVLPGGHIWIISSTTVSDQDKRGFVLKYTAQNGKLSDAGFRLDEKYRVRELTGNKVILTEGTDMYHGYTTLTGGIVLDLETGKISDERKKPE